jgi:hypothetical protein
MRLTLFHNGEVVIIEGDTEEVLKKADKKVVEWQSA